MADGIKHKWLVGAAAGLAVLACLLPSVTRAADWTLADWQINVAVEKNGVCRFEESRSYQFSGQAAFVSARWPTVVDSAVRDFTIIDESGQVVARDAQPVPDASGDLRYQLAVQPTAERQNWQISYQVAGCISYFDNYDAVQWPLTSDGWAEEISRLRIQVRLPRPAELLDRFSQSLTIKTAEGSRDLAGTKLIDAQTIEFNGQTLPAGSNVSFLASWPKGVLDDPGTISVAVRSVTGQAISAQLTVADQSADLTAPHVFRISDPALDREIISVTARHFGYQTERRELTLVRGKSEAFTFELRPAAWYQPMRYGLAGLILLLWIWPWWLWQHWYRRWRRSGRDPKINQMAAQTLGPGQLSPSELGVVVDERADRRDLTAGILFLAVHRYLSIAHHGSAKSQHGNNFSLIKLDKNPQALGAFEQHLRQWLFAKGATVTLLDLTDRATAESNQLVAELYSRVSSQGYFAESPALVRRRYLRWPTRWLIGSLSVTLAALVTYPSLFIAVLPLLIISVMAVVFAGIMPKKTLKGAEVAHWARQYARRKFDQPSRLTHPLPRWEFERALPYLLVLDADAMWLTRHHGSISAWPEWLRPADTAVEFTASRFVRLYNQFIAAADGIFSAIK